MSSLLGGSSEAANTPTDASDINYSSSCTSASCDQRLHFTSSSSQFSVVSTAERLISSLAVLALYSKNLSSWNGTMEL